MRRCCEPWRRAGRLPLRELLRSLARRWRLARLSELSRAARLWLLRALPSPLPIGCARLRRRAGLALRIWLRSLTGP